MTKRTALAIAALTTVAVLLSAQSAMAATTVGNTCLANSSLTETTIVQTTNDPGQANPATIPSAGVITKWSTNVPPVLAPGVLDEKLKVFEPIGPLGQLKAVGESSMEPILGTLNTFPTRIPVKAGDLIGSTGIVHAESETVSAVLYCQGQAAADTIGLIPGDVAVGSHIAIAKELPTAAQPITVAVEPDADGDGYGDETQDQCPTDASTQGPCPAPKVAPAPPAPITLSASTAAKKGLVTVTLTSTAQATVTVGGSVKLGKGKSAKLSGGTQIIAPGSLAKFTILFPAKLKAALKQLPTSKRLVLSLSASAPGATTKTLAVKVPGQKKATGSHHIGK
jgi:hypothetical protein